MANRPHAAAVKLEDASARVMAAAKGGEVYVSDTVRDIVVGSGLDFQDRGVHTLQGIEGERHLYALA